MSGSTTGLRSRAGEPSVEALLRRIDDAWADGPPADLDYLRRLLPADSPGTLVAEVVCEDIERRAEADAPPRLADYLSLHPRLADDDLALMLLEADVLARQRRGQPAAAAEYAALFPQFRTNIERLLAGQGGEFPNAGEYRLGPELGRGGMSVVYRATDPHFPRPLAVKVMKPGMPVERFLAEADLTARLQHPGIPPVHARGAMPDGRPFLVMKLIEGRTLAAILANPNGPQETALGWRLGVFERVCQTVAYAHSQGVIHRDLKPGNVMVGMFGEVQVMDWGLAKTLASFDQQASRLREGERPEDGSASVDAGNSPSTKPEAGSTEGALGTPGYMPPEQARGEVGRVDRRADVFALGAVLCELLTGTPPLTGPAGEVLRRAVAGDLEEAYRRLERCGQDPALVELARRCLNADPAGRPPDAESAAAAVAGYRADAAERARRAELARAEAAVQATEWRKRRRVQVALVGVLGLLGAVGLGVTWWADQVRSANKLKEIQHQAVLDKEREEKKKQEEALHRDQERIRQAVADDLVSAEKNYQGGKWELATTDLARAKAALTALIQPGELERRANEIGVDFDTLRRLESARVQRVGIADCKFDYGKNDPGIVFQVQYGLDVFRAPHERIVGLLSGRLIKGELAAALDDWAWELATARVPERQRMAKLLEVADALDPDETRSRLRQLIRRMADQPRTADTPAGIREELATLAKAARAGGQPPVTLLLIGNALAASGDGRRAMAFLEEGCERHPGDFWLHVRTGEMAALVLDPPDHDAAVRHTLAAWALRPDNQTIVYNLAATYNRLGDRERSFALLERAAEMDTADARTVHHLAGIRLSQGKLDEATRYEQRVLAIDPKFVPAMLNLALISARQRDLSGGIGWLEKARTTAAATDNAAALSMLSTLYVGFGRPKEAISCLTDAYRSRALRVEDVARFVSAAVALQTDSVLIKELAMSPEGGQRLAGAELLTAALRFERARVQQDTGAAKSALEAIRKLDPDNDSAMAAFFAAQAELLLAQAEATPADRQRRLAAAEQCGRRALALEPRSGIVHYLLAAVKQGADDLKGAEEEARAATATDPTNPDNWLLLCTVLYQQGRLKEAFDEGKYGLNRSPGDRRSVNGSLAQFLRRVELELHLPDLVTGKRAPSDSDEALGAARECERQKNLPAAVKFARDAVALSKRKDPEALNLLRHLLGGTDKKEALALARELVELAHNDPRLRGHLPVYRLYLAGHLREADPPQLEKALEQLDLAVAADRRLAPAHALRGEILVLKGRREDGLSALKKAAELDEAQFKPLLERYRGDELKPPPPGK